MPFILSIEHTPGKAKQYAFHLGTIEHIARTVAQEKMAYYVANDLPVVTMALKRHGKIVDVLYPNGIWHNDF
jgi:hypothetical protein